MENNQEIINQLQQINQKLEKLTNVSKKTWNNFLFGISKALGYLVGLFIITSVIIYIFSKFEVTKFISNYLQSTLSTYQISVPVPDQP
jgi:hypothetical protein